MGRVSAVHRGSLDSRLGQDMNWIMSSPFFHELLWEPNVTSCTVSDNYILSSFAFK